MDNEIKNNTIKNFQLWKLYSSEESLTNSQKNIKNNEIHSNTILFLNECIYEHPFKLDLDCFTPNIYPDNNTKIHNILKQKI